MDALQESRAILSMRKKLPSGIIDMSSKYLKGHSEVFEYLFFVISDSTFRLYRYSCMETGLDLVLGR